MFPAAEFRPYCLTLFCLFGLLPLTPTLARDLDIENLQERRSDLLEMHRRDPVAREALAREIAKIDTYLGDVALRAHQPTEAAGHFRSALVYDETHETARVGLIVSLLQTEQLQDALSQAFSGVAQHPDSADLLTLEGEVLYRLNRLDETVPAWRQALALRPDSALQERFEQVKRELNRTESYRTSEASHFTLQYDGERLDPDIEEAIVDTLEEGYDEFLRTLDHIPDATITVILYTRQEFRAITDAPSNVKGPRSRISTTSPDFAASSAAWIVV